METEYENKLPFLDILINKSDKTYSIYRKPKFSRLGTSFFSHCPLIFKVNAISTLLYRSYKLCSNYTLFHKEVLFLQKFFHDNGYPEWLFFKRVRMFLDQIYKPKAIFMEVPKLDFYCKLPYIGNNIKILNNELIHSLSKFYPQINFKFVFINNFKMSNLLPFKDKLTDPMRAGIIYSYNCPNCQVGYLGSSTRALKTRFSQHAGISDRTGRQVAVQQHSSIREHTLTCQSRLHIDHFKILDTCPNKIDLRILESIYIRKLRPGLNQDQSSFPLAIVE